MNKMNITYDTSKPHSSNTLFSVLTSPQSDKNTNNNGFNNKNEFLDSNIFDITNNSNTHISPVKNIIKNKIQSTSMNTYINKDSTDVYIKDLANSVEKSNQILYKMNNDNINTLKSIGSTGKERSRTGDSLSKMIGMYE
jgi:hypothetical protein